MSGSVTCQVECEPMLDMHKSISDCQLHVCVKMDKQMFKCFDEHWRSNCEGSWAGVSYANVCVRMVVTWHKHHLSGLNGWHCANDKGWMRFRY
jgi:hypothetical protein